MADIELVIKIPEEEYRWIKKSDKTVFSDLASKECMLHAIKNGTPLPKGYKRLIEDNIDLAINALEQTRWIPVSERLPEEHKEVLTCSNGGYIEIQSIEGTYGYWENQRGDWSDMDEVVAWMLLPQSYTKEVRDRNERL